MQKNILAIRDEEVDSEDEINKVDDSQKALYIEFHYIQDMHDDRDLKYRVKLIGKKQQEVHRKEEHAQFLDPEVITDKSGDICDFKGGLEIQKSDRKKKYFESQECFNVTKEDVIKKHMSIIIELYVYDKQYKPPIY